MADTIKDLLTMELQDTYSAETQILEALPQMEEAASTPSLKQAFQTHLQQTRHCRSTSAFRRPRDTRVLPPPPWRYPPPATRRFAVRAPRGRAGASG